MSDPVPRHRAQERLIAWQREAPWRAECFRAVDKLRASRALPRYTFLPVFDAFEIITTVWRKHHYVLPPGVRAGDVLMRDACTFAGYAAWRVTQGIYRFDPTLAAALADTPLTGDLPVSALTHLPHWCVYVETPGWTLPLAMGEEGVLHGYYAWIDWIAEENQPQLMLGLDGDQLYPHFPTCILPLMGTLEESIRDVEASARRNYEAGIVTHAPPPGVVENAHRLSPLISLLLFLCADDSEIGDGLVRPTQPQATKTKQGWRLFPADAPAVWDVGLRIGAAIRRAREGEAGEGHAAGERARPRAHIRRAHWGTYWTGPRSHEQTPVLRWLPPIPVNVDDIDALPATVHPVESV